MEYFSSFVKHEKFNLKNMQNIVHTIEFKITQRINSFNKLPRALFTKESVTRTFGNHLT